MSPLPSQLPLGMSFQKSDKTFMVNSSENSISTATLHAKYIPVLTRKQEKTLDKVKSVEQLAALYESLPDEEKYLIVYSPLILESEALISNIVSIDVRAGKVLRTLWRNQVPESVIWNMMTSSDKTVSAAGINWCSNPELLADVQVYLLYSEEVNEWLTNPATPYDLVQAVAKDAKKQDLIAKYAWWQRQNPDLNPCRLSAETLGHFLEDSSSPALAHYAVHRKAPSGYVADALVKSFEQYQELDTATVPDKKKMGVLKEVIVVILDKLKDMTDKDYAAECYESYLVKAEEIDFIPGLTPVEFLENLVNSKFLVLFGSERMEENLWW